MPFRPTASAGNQGVDRNFHRPAWDRPGVLTPRFPLIRRKKIPGALLMLEIITPPVVDEDFLALVYDHLKIETGDPEDTYSDPGEEEILDLVDSYVEAAL